MRWALEKLFPAVAIFGLGWIGNDAYERFTRAGVIADAETNRQLTYDDLKAFACDAEGAQLAVRMGAAVFERRVQCQHFQ